MDLAALNSVAQQMVAPGRGILAADESTGTIKKRFDAIHVENTEEARRNYRELMFRAKEAMQYVSGVILYDETIWQNAADGTPLVDLITAAGSIPGIKVDEGVQPLPGFPNETVTVGLDRLSERLTKYYARGARFAKWRAVIDIVLNGTFYCSRAFGLGFPNAAKDTGSILNIIATYAWTGNPSTAHSAAAKAGVWNLTKTLAVEWAPMGIRVNCLAPGPTETEAASANLFPTEEIRAAMTQNIPLRRFASLEDITNSARFLLSDEGGYITGETLVLDGGESLYKGMFSHSPQTPKG